MLDKYFIKAQYQVISVKQDSNQQRVRTIHRDAAQLQGYTSLSRYQLVEAIKPSYGTILITQDGFC